MNKSSKKSKDTIAGTIVTKRSNVKLANNEMELLTELVNELPQYAFLDGKRHINIVDKNILKPLPLIKFDDGKWKKLFPSDGITADNWKKLQMTEVGAYSISQPDISSLLISFVKEQINNYGPDNFSGSGASHTTLADIVITETNGGLAGFSLALLKEFNTINIVELNPTHYSIIKNNLELYKYSEMGNKHITIYENNYIYKMLELNQEIIISDPPWGGRSYNKNHSMRLGISNIDICHIINFLVARKKFRIFIFLAPHNFDFNLFMRNIDTNYCGSIVIKKVRRHNFVSVCAGKFKSST